MQKVGKENSHKHADQALNQSIRRPGLIQRMQTTPVEVETVASPEIGHKRRSGFVSGIPIGAHTL